MCEIVQMSDEKSRHPLDDVADMDDNQIASYADDRGWSWLFIAAEMGHVEAINEFIKRGFPLDIEKDGNTPMSLAFRGRHFAVVLNLLKANTRYPSNFNNEEASDDLKAFLELSNDLHDRIKSDKVENLSEIFTQNCNLRHFYDANNKSALCTAIEHKKFEVAKILLQNDVILGPFENIEAISRALSDEEKVQWKEMQLELSQALTHPTIMAIMANTFVGHDEKYVNHRRALVAEALDFLMNLPLVAPNLDVVSTARNYKLVFDFNRDTIQYLDLTATPFMNGTFETSGRVYIAAKNLSDDERKYEVFGVIAHELCHFAMYHVYNNMAKPYREDDQVSQARFTEVVEACRAKKDSEKVIWEVFENYSEDMVHAETIVRPPQMIAQHHGEYRGEKAVLDEKREAFDPLFDYYENKTIPELHEALPELRRKANFTEKDAKISKLKKSIIGLCFVIGLLIPIGVGVAYSLYKPELTWSELDDAQKMTVKSSKIEFKDVQMKFCELFPTNSTVFEYLLSDQLYDFLDDKTYRISEAIKRHEFDLYISLQYATMSDALRAKFKTQNVVFQGQSVEINGITSRNPSTLSFLTSKQILSIFNDEPVEVVTGIHANIKYYVDRYFADESAVVGSEDYEGNRVKAENFKSMNQVIDETQNTRIFLLADAAGEGKSTAFRQLTVRIKEKFHLKWVQFVDLKNFTKTFKSALDLDLRKLDVLKGFIVDDILKLRDLQRDIFLDRFDSGELVVIWDAVDEIFPLYSDFIIKLISELKNQTKNLQFLSTRTKYSEDLRSHLNMTAHKLVPLGTAERFELFMSFIIVESFSIKRTEQLRDVMSDISESLVEIDENASEGQLKGFSIVKLIASKLSLDDSISFRIFKTIFKGKKVFSSMEKSKNENRIVTNALLIRILGELATDDQFEDDTSYNFYTIFRKFMLMKINIDKKSYDESFFKAGDIKETHQAYAVKHIFSVYIQSFLSENKWSIDDFSIMKSTTMFTNDDISRYGIMSFDTDGNYNFAHLTFAEFWVAQFLIHNVDKIDFKSPDSHMKMFLLGAVLFTDNFEVVRNFLMSYASVQGNLSLIFSILKSQNAAIMKFEGRTVDGNILNFLMFSEFSKYYQDNFNISLNHYLTLKTVSFSTLKLDDFFDNFDEFSSAFGEQTIANFLLTSKDSFGFTMLHDIVLNKPTALLKSFCATVHQEFTLNQVLSLLFSIDNRGRIPMMLAASRQVNDNFNFVKHLWEFSEDYLSGNQKLRELLLLKDDFQLTVLQHSALSNDEKVFEYVKDIYDAHFERLEIQDILMATNQFETRFVERLIFWGHSNVVPEVAKYIEGLFCNDKVKLRELLFYQKDGKTAFDVTNLHESSLFIKPFIRRMLEDKCDGKGIRTMEDYKVFILNCLTTAEISLDDFKKLDGPNSKLFLTKEFMKLLEKLFKSFHYIKSSLDRNVVTVNKDKAQNGTGISGENIVLLFLEQLTTAKNLDELNANIIKENKNFEIIVEDLNSGRNDIGFLAFMNLFEEDFQPDFFARISKVVFSIKSIKSEENFLGIFRDMFIYFKEKVLLKPPVCDIIESNDDLQFANIFIDMLNRTFESENEFKKFVAERATRKSPIESVATLLPIFVNILSDSNSTAVLEEILNKSNGSLSYTDFWKILNLPNVTNALLENPEALPALTNMLQSKYGNSSILLSILQSDEFLKGIVVIQTIVNAFKPDDIKKVVDTAGSIMESVINDTRTKEVIDTIASWFFRK